MPNPSSHYKLLWDNYQRLWQAIIRPPRMVYSLQDLGPKRFRTNNNIAVVRTDFSILNDRTLKVECSHFEPLDRRQQQLPCVIYLPGNSSCRLQGQYSDKNPMGCTLLVFDFAGIGLSEGQYISLGYHQKDDIKKVVQYLRDRGTVSTVGLWGRSMGAISSLMYSDMDYSIAGLVLDSPFSSLEEVCQVMVKKFVSFPGVFSVAFKMISSTIKDKIGVDLKQMAPIQKVDKAFCPAFFIHGLQDQLIPVTHSQQLYQRYAGQKTIKTFQGTHNSPRPTYIKDSVLIFLYNCLQVQHMVKDKPRESSQDLPPLSVGSSWQEDELQKVIKLSQQQF